MGFNSGFKGLKSITGLHLAGSLLVSKKSMDGTETVSVCLESID